MRIHAYTFALAAFLLAAPNVSSAVVVSPDGSGDFPTIQEAVDAVADGDVIELTNGIFLGDGNRDIDYLGKAITIRSQSGDHRLCIIDCQGDPVENHRGFIFQSGEGFDSVLDGVTVTNGYWYDRAGAIFCGVPYEGTDCHPTIRGCAFIANEVGSAGGAISLLDSSPAIENCTFCGNSCPSFGGGAVWCDQGLSGSNPTITSCTFVDNSGPDGGAIWVVGSSPTIDRCIFAFNSSGGAVTCAYYPSSPTLTCCDIYSNVGGDWIGCIADQYGLDGNISEDPLFCDPTCEAESDDYSIASTSPCAPDANPDCGLIGAWPVDCGATPSQDTSWGRVKSMFR
jgi:hypothetical protein